MKINFHIVAPIYQYTALAFACMHIRSSEYNSVLLFTGNSSSSTSLTEGEM